MKIGTDKWQHYLLCLIIALIASAVIANAIYQFAPNNPGLRTAISYGAALFVTMAIGVWKECRDRKKAGNHFCWRDLTADAIGAVMGSVGAFVSYLL